MRGWSGQALPEGEPQKLLAATGGGWLGKRDRAALVLMWRAGLRTHELVRLDVADVVPRGDEGGEVRVRYPKGRRRGANGRVVGIDQKTLGYVLAWKCARVDALHMALGRGPLFVTAHQRRLDTSRLRRMMKRLARRAEIPEARVHPHALRHTFARELYDEGIGVREIQLALGHTSLATTAHYLTAIGAIRAVETTRSRTW